MSAEDKLAILEQIGRYSYTFDGKDADGWAALFTPGAVWESVLRESGKATERLEGREVIRAWAAARHRSWPDTWRSFHHQSGTVFDEIDTTTARTRTMLILTGHDLSSGNPMMSAGQVTMTGIYYDRWQRDDAVWMIAHRTLEF